MRICGGAKKKKLQREKKHFLIFHKHLSFASLLELPEVTSSGHTLGFCQYKLWDREELQLCLFTLRHV
jgi:hypothetical protein